MPRDARFWRNAAIITIGHVAVVVGLVLWSHETRKANLPGIVWLSGSTVEAAELPVSLPPVETPPPPEPDASSSKPDEPEKPAPTEAKSDIQLPGATPSPVPRLAPKRAVTPVPKPTAKTSPKSTPKKFADTKTAPKPSPKKSATPSERKKAIDEVRKEPVKIAPAHRDGVEGKKAGITDSTGSIRSSEFSWYGKMLHDRFYSEWIQPTTSVAVGARMSALVRIRIEKDGRISKFTLARPSGNVVVDESVAAVAKRVTQVDPLPAGLGGGAFYEVNINFELNPEQ